MGMLTNTMNKGYDAYDQTNAAADDAWDAAIDTIKSPFDGAADGIAAIWDRVSGVPSAMYEGAGDFLSGLKETLDSALDVARYGVIAYAVAAIAAMPLAYYAYKTGLILKVTTFIGEILNAIIRGIGLVV